MYRRAMSHRPTIARAARIIALKLDHGSIRRAVARKAGHQGIVVQHGEHSLRGHREVRSRANRADERAELFASHRGRLDANLHPRLDGLASVARDVDDRREGQAFTLDLDDWRADGQDGTRRHLELDNATVNRADNLGASLELA